MERMGVEVLKCQKNAIPEASGYNREPLVA